MLSKPPLVATAICLDATFGKILEKSIEIVVTLCEFNLLKYQIVLKKQKSLASKMGRYQTFALFHKSYNSGAKGKSIAKSVKL